MTSDPIVQEVREARVRLFAECHDDLEKLMDRLEASEKKDSVRIVTPETWRDRQDTRRRAV